MDLRRLSVFFSFAATLAAAQSPPLQSQAPGLSTAQQVWQMQDSGTTAGLRGIDSVDLQVAWASGTEGTVLRTTDGGAHWRKCAVPEGDKDGATLDFRGVQAWDATTAIVMASGPGDKSRLYKTTDGCKTWRLVLSNADPKGFWDALAFSYRNRFGPGVQPNRVESGFLVGDPVSGEFPIFTTEDSGDTWWRWKSKSAPRRKVKRLPALARSGEAPFAASNEAAESNWSIFVFVTGGVGKARLFLEQSHDPLDIGAWYDFKVIDLPMPASETAGAFALAVRRRQDGLAGDFMVVGGDYKDNSLKGGTAVFVRASFGRGIVPTASTTPPHGYRSTVQWDAIDEFWITAGTNGSDISRDDGRTWQPLDDGNWNALSLPFIVGPKGRIARLDPKAIPNP